MYSVDGYNDNNITVASFFWGIIEDTQTVVRFDSNCTD